MGCTESSQNTGKLTGLQISKEKQGFGNGREFKVVLLGEAGVGKSSIAQRFCHNKFSDAYEVTIGGAYLQRMVQLKSGASVKLHLWDTSGEERFRAMAPLYYRDANAVVMVYDVGNVKSFHALDFWTREIESKRSEKIVVGLVGNKNDLDPTDKMISTQEGRHYAESNRVLFGETSAKLGTGIEEFFYALSEDLYKVFVLQS
jgi:small GTP-binding protein